ncbi:MAG: hypothetical protein GXO88_11755 [Chlorobi bacterium]|nr:hypothetical protein [Chlorobiota bacterium]
MKKLLTIVFAAVLSGLIIVPRPVKAQDVKPDKKKKTISIKTVREENGKQIVTDTTFTFSGDMDELDLGKSGISNDSANMDVEVQVVVSSEGENTSTKRVVVMNAKDVKVGEGGKNTKVFKWTDKDGNEMAFNIDVDKDDLVSDLNRIEAELVASGKELEDEYLMLYGKLSSLDSLKNLADFEGMEKLAKLNDLDLVISSSGAMPPHHPDFMLFFDDNTVSDVELRDAGIKSKPDRLEIENMNLDIDNGVVDLEFSVKQEINPKVVVYNVYGDKVFSGKPSLMNGNYQLKMDLSKKQHGTYYLMIVSGKSSFTSRMKL